MASIPHPNFGGADLPDDNNGPRLLIATGIVTIFAFISVVARIYVRKFLTKSSGWDDVFIVAAMVRPFSLRVQHLN